MVGMCKNPDCGVKKDSNDSGHEITAEQYLDYCHKCQKILGATKNGKDAHTARHR